MLPATTERVTVHTAEFINQRILRETEDRVCYYAGHPAQIDTRLQALDREWDIERVLSSTPPAWLFSASS